MGTEAGGRVSPEVSEPLMDLIANSGANYWQHEMYYTYGISAGAQELRNWVKARSRRGSGQ